MNNTHTLTACRQTLCLSALQTWISLIHLSLCACVYACVYVFVLSCLCELCVCVLVRACAGICVCKREGWRWFGSMASIQWLPF